MTVLVYRYGIPKHVHEGDFKKVRSKKTGKNKRVRQLVKVTVPTCVQDQLWLGHRVREDLVSIEYDYEVKHSNAWRMASPELAESMNLLAAAEKVIEQLEQEARDERVANRSVAVKENTAAVLKKARLSAKEARTAITNLKAQKAIADVARISIALAKEERLAAYKALYGQYCTAGVVPLMCNECMHAERTVDQETGVCTNCGHEHERRRLYHGTYNKVLAQHKATVARLVTMRKEGQRAQLRHHKYDGTGRIAVQLVRAHGPKCRCAKCLSTELMAWKVIQRPDDMFVVTRRATTKPKFEGVDPVIFATVEEVSAFIGQHTNYPPAAIQMRELKGANTPDGYIIPWSLYIDAAPLVGLGEPKDQPRLPSLLATTDHKWRNVFQLRPWMTPEEFEARKSKNPILGEVVFHVDGAGCVTLPVVLTRMIPEGSEILEAQLVVTREAERVQMHLCVTVDEPDPAPTTMDTTIAVHVGWRKMENYIRVATWASDKPIQAPLDLQQWNVAPGITRPLFTADETGMAGDIRLPMEWLDLAGRPSSINAIRATKFNAVREDIANWLTLNGDLEPFDRFREPIVGAKVRQWRSISRFTQLAYAMMRHEEKVPENIRTKLRHWLFGDGTSDWHGERHLWQYATHEAAGLLRRRDDAWLTVAKRIATMAGTVLIDDVDLASLAKSSDEATTAASNPIGAEQETKIRFRARLAAPGGLRTALQQAAGRQGATAVVVAVDGLKLLCPHCGHSNPSKDPRWRQSMIFKCNGCEIAYDQDHVVSKRMLERA